MVVVHEGFIAGMSVKKLSDNKKEYFYHLIKAEVLKRTFPQ